MRRTLCVVSLALALQACAAFGQSMTEVSVAAGGGSVAGAAGKSVSNGFDKIMGKLAKQTSDAAQAKPAAKSATGADAAPAGSGSAAPPVRARRVTAAKPEPAKPAPVAAEPEPTTKQPQPEPPPVTSAQLAEVHSGVLRTELLASLGTPFARILMPEEGHLVEIYQYAAKGRLLGAVRLTDGVVSSVRVDN